MASEPEALQHSFEDGPSGQRLALRGALLTSSLGSFWRTLERLDEKSVSDLREIDASGLTDFDSNGLALLLSLQSRVRAAGGDCPLTGLEPEAQKILDQLEERLAAEDVPTPPQKSSFVVAVGESTLRFFQDLRTLIAFVGELTLSFARALRHPSTIRWRDTLVQAELVGVNALPIIILLGFLIGLILAYQALIPMQEFGAGIFVANLVSLSLLRELGPLMTAVILAGRSGSAFAAEIGTMKVDEELDALETFGLDSRRYMSLPRVMATVFMAPLLTIFLNLVGLMGAIAVMLGQGYAVSAFIRQVKLQVDYVDLLGGLFKALVFGLLVAGIGCLRGFQTGSGASSVGVSATRAVVSGIVLIIAADGIFAVLYNTLGI
ncbi:MAG: MlaE family lipid ABC transporter permease subunit [Planctomycetota bacterium]